MVFAVFADSFLCLLTLFGFSCQSDLHQITLLKVLSHDCSQVKLCFLFFGDFRKPSTSDFKEDRQLAKVQHVVKSLSRMGFLDQSRIRCESSRSSNLPWTLFFRASHPPTAAHQLRLVPTHSATPCNTGALHSDVNLDF